MMKLIKDKFPITDNFFSNINYDYHDLITPLNMSILFYSNYGLRPIAPICNNVDNQVLGEMIYSLYYDKWEKLYNVYTIEYNPIYNYYDEYEEEKTGAFEENHEEKIETDSTDKTTNALSQLTTNDLKNDSLRTDNLTQSNTGTVKNENTRTDSLTQSNTGTVGTVTKVENNLTEQLTNNLNETLTATNKNGLYGFNSTSAVGDNESDGNSTKQNTGTATTKNTGTVDTNETVTNNLEQTNTGTVKDDGTVTNALSQLNSGTVKNENSNTGTIKVDNTGDVTRTLDSDVTNNKKIANESSGTRRWKHIGNIGNLTSQQMISQEIELWKWNWLNQILEDVKDFLTIPVYDNSCKKLELIDGESY